MLLFAGTSRIPLRDSTCALELAGSQMEEMRAHWRVCLAPPCAPEEKRMRAFLRLTPNLVVRDIDRSLRFYCDVLDFELDKHVPEKPPFVFASVRGGGVEIFLNDFKAATAEYPNFAEVPVGGTLTLYLAMQGIDELYAHISGNGTKILMPIETKFYGVREFAIADPDGYLITLAERVNHN
jgi:uncharacterized glyoxalase superfamily protein PhnB